MERQNHDTAGDWIESVKEPYETVVGRSNQPPLPLRSLIETQAGSREDLLTLYKELDTAEEEFADEPDWVKRGRAKGYFDQVEELPVSVDQLSWAEQREKWFQYAKLRVLAALKKVDSELPDDDIIQNDWYGGPPDEEVALVLLLDEHVWLDSEDPEALAQELERNSELREFLYEVYSENRDLRRKIQKLERPGVTYALLEAYGTRIEMLNEVYTSRIQEQGMDEIHDRLTQSEAKVRQTRTEVEQQVSEALSEQIVPHIEAIENRLSELADEDVYSDATSETPKPISDDQLWQLRQDIQDFAITEQSDLKEEIAELRRVRDGLERTINDKRDERYTGLNEIGNELEQMNDELATIGEQIDDQVAAIYETVVGDDLTGASFEQERPVVEELTQLLWLYVQLTSTNEDGSNLNTDTS
jgi:tetrahydromethanopterin S-methyltransferase subunit G/HAMP domain-containing protein